MSGVAVLDIDMGNTRVKWRPGGPEGQVSSGDCLYRDGWAASIMSREQTVARVRIASVAGPQRTGLLLEHCRSRWQLEPELAASVRHCAGVTNGYKEPGTMGVDRWLAVIAAYNKWRRACLIVDCGSAVTVDMVDNQGLHLGGYIVPGMHLMRRALFQDTDAVKVTDATVGPRVGPGDNTADAVNRGVLLMVVGFVAEAHRQMTTRFDLPVTVVVTGGDGERVGALLEDACICPDLVLDGLALALP